MHCDYREDMKPYEKLGEATTPDGTVLALYRHDGAYLIRADGVELMSTRRHHSEDRLAELACAHLAQQTGTRVLVGGLGLGFTMRAALRVLPADAEVVVAEFLPEVVDWNTNPAFGISTEAMRDPRVRIVQDDIVNVLRDNAGGFDAIMLDTDNGPDGQLMSENTRLYSARGVTTTLAARRPGGVLAYWSVANDPRFARALRQRGLAVATVHARAHETSGPFHTIYVVTNAPATDAGPA
jgi:spermidine synthase